MASIARRHPVLFSALMVLSTLLLDTYSGILIGKIAGPFTVQQIGIITGGIVAIYTSVLLQVFGWWRQSGFQRPFRWKGLLWFLPFFLYGLLPLGAGIAVSPSTLLLGTVAGYLIAFWKLSVLGILLVVLADRGKWQRVLLSAVFFGVMHLGGLLAGSQIAATLVLSLSYVFLAIAFGSLWLRTGALWPAILTYGLFLSSAFAIVKGIAPNLAPTVSSILPAVFTAAILAAYSLFALAGAQRAREPVIAPQPV